MKNKIHTPFGVRDILPEECSIKRDIEKKAEEIFKGFGYKEVVTPMFEYIEVFSNKNMGGIDSKNMYKFYDRDGEIVALRSDMTPPIARLTAMAYLDEVPPLRFSYFGNAFRFNDSYQGKLSEFSQGGIELIGDNSPMADSEAIGISCLVLKACGFKDFKLMVGDVNIFKGILSESGLSIEKQGILQEIVGSRNYVKIDEFIEKESIKPKALEFLRTLPRLVGGLEVIAKARELTENKEALEALRRMEEIYRLLSFYEVGEYISFDLGMVSRFNYYTGIIFRGYTNGSGYSIVDGGRYDNLVETFGKSLPSVGFGLKINEIITAKIRQGINDTKEDIRSFFAYSKDGLENAVKIGCIYRKSGSIVETSLKAMDFEEGFSYAKNKDFSYLLYFENEAEVRVISFKDEMGGYTVKVPISELLFPKEEEK